MFVKEALMLAEKEKGGPVYMIDVYRVAYHRSCTSMLLLMFVVNGLEDLYYNDEILADKFFHLYSLDPSQQHTDDN